MANKVNNSAAEAVPITAKTLDSKMPEVFAKWKIAVEQKEVCSV